jgi:hypothetical protein
MTKSPTVIVWSTIPFAARYIIPVNAELKIMFWPMLRAAREVEILTLALV